MPVFQWGIEMKRLRLLVASALVAVPALASAQQMDMPNGGMDMGGSAADEANMKALQKMQDDMPNKGTGNADWDFVTMMISHHQGAVDMAKVEVQYGKDPALKKMASKIVEDQEKEIRLMKTWLDTHK